MGERCQYCNDLATHHEEPWPGAGYVQHLCEHHYNKGFDMAREYED